MSAEMLRRASALMRERESRAVPGDLDVSYLREMCALDGDWGGTEWGEVLLYLLDRLTAIEALADGWGRDVAVLRGDAACGDIEADWLANNRQQHLDQLHAALLTRPEEWFDQ